MTRGQGGQSPSNISHYLKGIDFPATKDQLLEHAQENDAEQDVLDKIESMPDEEYQSMADVMKGYGESEK